MPVRSLLLITINRQVGGGGSGQDGDDDVDDSHGDDDGPDAEADDDDDDSADGARAPASPDQKCGGAASQSCGNMCNLPHRGVREMMIHEASDPTPRRGSDQIPKRIVPTLDRADLVCRCMAWTD